MSFYWIIWIPLGTAYLHTVAKFLKTILVLLRSSEIIASQILIKSEFNIDKTFIASGSPKRALYSINSTPALVAIKPPYSIPL